MLAFLRRHCLLPRVSLQWALTVPGVLQTVGLVGLVGYLSYTSGQRSIQNLAYQLMETVDQQVSNELDHYLQSAPAFNQQQATAIQAGVMSPQNLEPLHRYLILQHRQAENLTTLLFGTPQGDLLVSHRVSPRDYGVTTPLTPEELPFEVAVSEAANPSLNRTYGVDAEGNLGRFLKTVNNIDVRDRPWYRDAVATGAPGWTEPFQIADTNLLALNAYQPLFGATGELTGVFAVNISLNQLSDTLQTIEVGDSGEVFILERNGQLIATSTGEAVYTTIGEPNLNGFSEPGTLMFERRSPADMTSPLLQTSYQHLQETYGDFATLQTFKAISFSVQGERYFLTISPYSDDYGLDWLVATVVPASDFMAEIQQNNRTTLWLCLIALGGAIAFGTLLSKRIASKFADLDQAGQKLAQGNFEPSLSTNSAIAEVEGLATSFNQVAARLRQLFQQQVDVEATRQSEARFQQLAAAVPGMIYAFTLAPDGHYRYEYVSAFSQDLLELKPEEIIADADIAVQQIHPDDRPAVLAAMERAFKDAALFCQTYRIVTASGQLKWLEESARPLQREDGSITWYGILLDVSDRQAAETALRESELRYRILAESSPVGIFRHDLAGQCIYANTKTLEMIGLSLEEVLTNDWSQHLHPDDRASIYASWQSFVDQVSRGELASYVTEQRYLFPDGSLKWGLAQAVPEYNTAGEVVGFVGSIADITDLKQTEESLKAKTAELDRFFSVSLDLLCIANTDGYFLRVNPQWEKVLGYPIAELEGSRFLDYVHPEDVEATQQAIAQLSRQAVIEGFLNRYRCQDGSYRWLEWRSFPVGPYIYAAARDITERQQIEMALRASEARKQAILSAIPDIIFLLDAQGFYLESIRSNAVVDMVAPDIDPVGKHISELLPPELANQHLQMIQQVLQTRQLVTFEQEVNIGDRVQYEELTIIPCEANTVLGLIRDITERKRMEADLRSLNKHLETLATVDSLTQVANRRQMAFHLDQEWDRCQRSQQPLTLVLVDIDHFKRYNDQYGHPQGDACLKQVADILQSHVNRPGDLVSRYGGEEFLLVLPQTEQAGALYLVEMIQQSLAQAQIPHADSLTDRIVTISMGVLVIMDVANFESPAAAIAIADKLLYQAKQTRNTYLLQVL
jgi:diguanylate cyclase (GGDEF)-like protein/PAS domain S-box-containing protein